MSEPTVTAGVTDENTTTSRAGARTLGRPARTLLRYVGALAIVAAASIIADVFSRLTGTSRLTSIFLSSVLLTAFYLGVWPGYLAAAAALVAHLYLVDPPYKFSLGSVEEMNALLLFTAASTLTCLLAGRVREERRTAAARASVNAVLLDATRELADATDQEFIRTRLAQRLQELAGSPLLAKERQAAVELLTDTGAAAMTRAKLAAEKAVAEARARTEELRNALLSSISHDLRTPLAAILASASSLQEFSEAFDAATRRDLASTIKEEAERLDLFVANLLNMSRLEAGALTLQRVGFSVPEVVARTLDRRTRGRARPAEAVLEDGLPDAYGDPILFEQALGNVIENAARYTPESAPLSVSARLAPGFIEVRVCDAGPGLSAADLGRVFEKFYRAQTSLEKSGTGLGLSITRGLIQAMGGSVSAANRPDGPGLTVTLCIPVAE